MPRIETGHAITRDVSVVRGKRVRFVDDNGHTVFEVVWNDDGRSIDVRGVETTGSGEECYGPYLDLRMQCANVVTVMARPLND